MKSLPTNPFIKTVPEEEDTHYPMDEKKHLKQQQQQESSTSTIDLYDFGSSTDKKKLPPSPTLSSSPPPPPPPSLPPMPPMHSIPPPAPPPLPPHPVEFMAETSPMQRSKRPLRRRRCLLGWLCVALVILLAAVFVFVLYGIPASRCCSCLIAYDKCKDGLASTDNVGQKTCLDRFYTCSANSIYIFFDCNDRLYTDRHLSCWIQYFDD